MLSFPQAARRSGPLRRLATVGAVGWLAYATLMVFIQRDLIFPRGVAPTDPGAAAEVPGIERWTVPVAGGVVEAWYMPAPQASPATPRPAVIFAHGNGETSDQWIRPLQVYRQAGFSVLIPEYRGYGRSAGSPSEAGIVADFAAFHDRLRGRPEVDPNRIFFHGRSLGGGVICSLTRLRSPAGVVLQSTFRGMVAMAHRRLLPGFIVADRFDSLDAVRHLTVPVYVAHGRRDPLIPFADGEALAQAATAGEFHPLECAHADCPPDDDEFLRDTTRFFSAIPRARRPAP